MKKEIVFDEELSKKLMNGAKITAKAIKTTLGPCGRFALIPGANGMPIVTKDGVSVGKAVELEDPVENYGASLIKEISSSTDDNVGDGTTTSSVIAEQMIINGYKMVSAGCQPIELKRGMDKASEIAIDYLKKISVEIDDNKKVEQVATISANNDPKIGKLIAEAYSKVGKDGIVNVEETKGTQTSVEVTEGTEFDEGWISNYFITNKQRAEVDFEDAVILVTDKKINLVSDIIGFLDYSKKNNKPLLIICEELEQEALNVVIYNVINGGMKVAAVRAPSYGIKKQEYLEDIATLVGATFISEKAGYVLKDCDENYLGSAKSVKITRNSTIIVNGGGDKEIINNYVNDLKAQKELLTSPRDKDIMSKRIAKFFGSAATIRVGAETKTEAGELKYRVEDAKRATKAALDDGIVPGGGYSLLLASKELEKQINNKNFPTDDMKQGAKIVADALKAPLKQIAENAGVNGEVILATCEEKGLGYNAKTGQYVNMIEDGVIDPTKVEIASVKNSNSVVGVLLASGCAIANKE